MERIRRLPPEDAGVLCPWPPLPGRVGWRGEQLAVSPDFPRDLCDLLAAALDLLCSLDPDVRAQGAELIAPLPPALRELAQAAAVAARVTAASREQRTFLPRFWRISARNLARLERLGLSLGADEVHLIDDDATIECEVYYLGI